MLKSGKQSQAFYEELWTTIQGGDVWSGRLVNKRKDGKLYEEEATISPVYDGKGQIAHYVGVKRDITEQETLERRLRQAQKLEAIGTLAGGIAHDFNNALAAIVGYTQMCAEELPEDSTQRADLDHVLAAARRSTDLVRQILTFSRQVEQERHPYPASPHRQGDYQAAASVASCHDTGQRKTWTPSAPLFWPTRLRCTRS